MVVALGVVEECALQDALIVVAEHVMVAVKVVVQVAAVVLVHTQVLVVLGSVIMSSRFYCKAVMTLFI